MTGRDMPPVDPETVPIDPEDIDATRPVDIDACIPCAGTGVVLILVDGERTDDVCPTCQGRGVR